MKKDDNEKSTHESFGYVPSIIFLIFIVLVLYFKFVH